MVASLPLTAMIARYALCVVFAERSADPFLRLVGTRPRCSDSR